MTFLIHSRQLAGSVGAGVGYSFSHFHAIEQICNSIQWICNIRPVVQADPFLSIAALVSSQNVHVAQCGGVICRCALKDDVPV